MGKGMELPCPLWVRHCPQIYTCSPTWNLLELVLLSFYGGCVTWLIKALATDGWTQSPVLSFLLTLEAEGWREESESAKLLISLHNHTNDNVLRTSFSSVHFSSVQLLSRVRLFVTLWIAACQTSLSITNSWSLLKLIHWVSDAIQPSHPLSSPSPPAPQSLPASGSFPMSQLFAWGSQRFGVSASASVLPMNTQDWSPLGWTGWISLQSKGLSRVFSNTIVQMHQFFGAQLSSQSNSHIHTWSLEKP